MTAKELVGRLLATASSPFTEADRQRLEGFGEERLTQMLAHCEKVAKLESAAAPEKPEAKPEEKPAAAAPAAAAAPETKPEEKKPASTEEWLESAPDEVRSAVKRAMAQDAEHREKMIALLKAEQSVYDEAKLKAMSIDQLGEVVRLLRLDEPVVNDFGGRALASTSKSVEKPDPWAAGIEQRKKDLGLVAK